jgi:hypothetical protein
MIDQLYTVLFSTLFGIGLSQLPIWERIKTVYKKRRLRPWDCAGCSAFWTCVVIVGYGVVNGTVDFPFLIGLPVITYGVTLYLNVKLNKFYL